MLYLHCTSRTTNAYTIENSTAPIAEVKISATGHEVKAAPGHRITPNERAGIQALVKDLHYCP